MKGERPVRLAADSLAARIYGRTVVEEEFACSYELNPEYQPLFEDCALHTVGRGDSGEARVVELAGHPFFVGTLFLPQMRTPDAHPLVRAFVASALNSR